MSDARQCDEGLLAALESGIPLEPRPFGRIAEALSSSEEEILARTRDLLASGRIRRIAVSIDSRALGFEGTLVAAKAAPGRDAEAVSLVNSHFEVTHNYRRCGCDLDIWFTILAPDRARIDALLAALAASGFFERLVELPAVRRFKVDVRFTDAARGALPSRRPRPEPSPLSPLDRRVVSAVSAGLEPVARPFAALAAAAGCSEAQLLETLRALLALGVVRKVAAILDSGSLGLTGALVAWRVEPGDVERAGAALAALGEVTHCYERIATPDWPWNVYTMVHGAGEEELRAWASDVSARLALGRYLMLFTRGELKRSAPRYRF